jgi:precorrin-6A/cobalt-precorrin-6A reductase
VPDGPERILIIGGTGEAASLGRELSSLGYEVTLSLVGLTAPVGGDPYAVRRGGFGGAEGLAEELVRAGYALLVDASHPFSARMAANAAAAAELAGVERLRLLRPPWEPGEGDRWHHADDLAEAAALVSRLAPHRVFLAVGRRGAVAFAGLEGAEMVVRSATSGPPPIPGARQIVERGPFEVEDEVRLLTEWRIDLVATRNSGGSATVAKLVAARRLGIPVVMVAGPAPPSGQSAAGVGEAIAWVQRQLS